MGNTHSKLDVEAPEHIANHQDDFSDCSLGVTRRFNNDGSTSEKRKFCSINAKAPIVSPESENNHEVRAIMHRKRMRTSSICNANVNAENSIPSKNVGDSDVIQDDLSSHREITSIKTNLPQNKSQMRLNTQAQDAQDAQDSELESMQERTSKDSSNDISQQLQDAKVENECLKQSISVKDRLIKTSKNDCRKWLKALEKEAIYFRNQLIAMTSEKMALEEQLTQAKKEAEMFKKDSNDWNVENRELQTKLVLVQEKQNATVVTGQHCQSAAMSKLQSLLQQRKEDRMEVQVLKNEVSTRQQYLKSCEMEVEDLIQRVTATKTDSSALHNHGNGQPKSLERQLGDYGLSSLENEKNDLTKHLELAKKEITEQSQSIKEYANVLRQRNTTLASLTLEKGSLQEKVDSLEKASKSMQSAVEQELSLTLRAHEYALMELRVTLAAKCEENKRHVRGSKKIKATTEALGHEIESYKKKLKSHENRVISLFDEKEELAEKLKVAQSDVVVLQQEVFEKAHFIIESTYSYESRLSKLQKENEALAAKEQSQSDAISKLFKEMRATEACRYRKKDPHSRELKAQETDMKVSCEHTKSWGDENKELIEQLAARESDMEGLQAQVESLDNEKIELTKQLKVRESSMKELQTRVELLNDEKAKLIEQIEARAKDMKGLQTHVKSLDDENSKLVKQLIAHGSDMNGSQAQLKKSFDELTKRLKARESKMVGLQTQVKSLDDEKRELSKQLKARESDLKHLQENAKSNDEKTDFQQSKSMQKEAKGQYDVKEKSKQDEKIDELQKEFTDCSLAYEAKLVTLQKAKECLAERHSAALLKLSRAFEADQQRLQTDNEKLQKQEKRRLEAIGLLQEQLDTLEDETTRLNRLNETNNKAHNAALSKLSEEKRVMQNTVKAQNKELELLRSRRDKEGEGQTKLLKLEKENKALLMKEKRHKSQIERLKGSNSHLTDQKKEIMRLNRENKTFIREVELAKTMLVEREKEVNRLRMQLKAQSNEKK